jgi:predicted metal-dependent HD superfamily phosphohydrolase
MKKIDDVLVEEAKQYVSKFLAHELSEKCLFHTISHTLEVLKNAEIIGRYCNVDEDQLNILRISALFHDVGYVDAYDDHEIFSAKRAVAYLADKKVDVSTIAQIEKAILSTKTPQNPQDKISRILCDADLMNLTFDDYFEQVDLMREEWEKVGKAKLNSHQFYLNTLEFFRSHEYHSKYGKTILQPKKEMTEREIKKKVLISK